jgi:hypothetical protein
MSITLDEVLLMVGRLDDAHGFDSPRDRYRRFITAHVRDVRIARAFIEQCQRSLGEQHHRALKDLVTLLGRFLGLETAFGSYLPIAGALRYDGHWRYPRRINIVLEVRSDQTQDADVESLSRSVAALGASSLRTATPPPMGLSVVASHYARGAALQQAIESRKGSAGLIKSASIRSLLTLADMVAAGRVTRAEGLRILSSDLSIDFLVDLLERPAVNGSAASQDAKRSMSAGAGDGPGFWIAAVVSDAAATPEQIVERVIGKRRLFGLRHGSREAVPRSGDRICFHVHGVGIVGHAPVVSVAEDGAGIRDASRFSHVLHLGEPELYLRAPILPSPATERRLDAAGPRTNGHTVIRISEREFLELTAGPPAVEADPGRAALTAADSRSRE